MGNFTLEVFPNEGDITISDGYHTMDELYEHRMILFCALFNSLSSDEFVWKSKFHSDGSPMFEGMFIAGIGYRVGMQITYHLDLKYWDLCGNDQHVMDMRNIPVYDSHNSQDVIHRLTRLCQDLN